MPTPVKSARARMLCAAFGAVAVLTVAGCGGGDGERAAGSPSAAASGAHNGQDVSFAQGMIPHHRQAVEMAELAPERAGSAEVRGLAVKIQKAQDPEIRTMSGWLTAWGETVPADGAGHGGHGGHTGHGEHGGGQMAGMMDEAAMAKLKKLHGAAFDTAFLTMMVAHHQGAVRMAETEKSKGAYGPARKMAASVIDSQSAEIERMRKLVRK
ncbi:DUF305 domain-containing protein [Streptomyces sp. NPDC058045]|uniref:DUF305 domain-containing protein n=1 Tax=Streptomyces sp. NPDC058045 TaxID=3346311 RepID=UPI0036EEC2C3